MKKEKAKPLQVLFKGEVMKVIENLKKETGSSSRAEVVRDAINLYKILNDISKGKNLVVSPVGGKSRILCMPVKVPKYWRTKK